MALLQFQALSLNNSSSSWPSRSTITTSAAADVASWGRKERRSENISTTRRNGRISSSLQENATVTVTIGQVTEVTKDTFWPIVGAADDKTVVLDMYTQWCGPCKVMAPKFKELSEKYSDVVFLKLDCNQDNKPLAKELGIKVVPTFKILKDGKVVKEVTGAKLENLVEAIETVRSSS